MIILLDHNLNQLYSLKLDEATFFLQRRNMFGKKEMIAGNCRTWHKIFPGSQPDYKDIVLKFLTIKIL